MVRITACRLAAAFALVLSAWAPGAAAGPAAADTSGGGLSAELERLRSQDRRVAGVAFRIRTTNLALCPSHTVAAGWTLHNAPQYGPRLRAAAVQHFGLKGSYPSVLALAPDGPAARAGVRADDVITAVNGQPLGQAPVASGPGDFEALSADLARIDAALAAGPARLALLRGGAPHEATVEAAAACTHEAQVNPSATLQASADGKRVFITTALVDFASDDDELAFVLGHEYAHNFLGHREELDRKGFARSVLGNLATPPWHVLKTEREADRLGVYLAARAGYDTAAAPAFFEKLGRREPSTRFAQWGHPSAGSRLEAMQAIVAEIEAQERAGLALAPRDAP